MNAASLGGVAAMAALAVGLEEVNRRASDAHLERLFDGIDTSKPQAAMQALKATNEDLSDSFGESQSTMERFRHSMIGFSQGEAVAGFLDKKQTLDEFKGKVEEVNDVLKGLEGQAKVDYLVGLRDSAESAGKPIKGIDQAIQDARDSMVEAKGPTDDLAASTIDLSKATESATEGTKKLLDVSRAQIDPFFAVMDANQKLTESHWDVIAAQAEHGKGSKEYEEAIRNAGKAAMDMDAATRGLAAAVKDGTTSMPEAIARVEELGKSAGMSDEEVAGLKWQVFLYSKQVEATTGQSLDLDVSPALAALRQLQDEAKKMSGALARIKSGYYGWGQVAGGGLPGGAWGTSAAAPMAATPMAVPGSAPSVANVTINMPPGTPTSRTLSELRRYRRGGGDMSGLIDNIVAVR